MFTFFRNDHQDAGRHHTKKGPGRKPSLQVNGYRKPGADASRKRLLKKTGGNRL